ncbi:hypothetical protein INR49_006856 [Caranx melampygus]|nr:hypothetical protein INR49_006856 [Caranx melampygus]
MAKWGEGDPRWIVEERADATNVNNWHWTERDVSTWSSQRLRQLLLGVRVAGPEGVCHITDITKLDGEASINNRKGKLIFFYEWQLRAGWLGTSSSGVKFRGTVDVSNLSDENDTDDLDISVSLCKDQPNTPLLDLMRRTGVPEVCRILGLYVEQLKSGPVLKMHHHQPITKNQGPVQTRLAQFRFVLFYRGSTDHTSALHSIRVGGP